MARSLTPRDAHVLINLICKEATGQDPEIQAVDASTFVSVGEKILATGTENTLNAISMVIGRTFMAVRPYTSKFRILEETDVGLYQNRVRKISYMSRYALASGDWNTQLFTNLANGFDNGENGVDAVSGDPVSTKSMWVQNQAIPLELNFAGMSTWQDSTTVYRDQLKVAFADEASFNSFIAGILTEKGNDIELQREAFRRLTLLNHIAGVYAISDDYPTMVVNLTTAYNTKFGTNYTSEELRTTYLKSFLEFLVATIKQVSRRMEYRTAAFHMPYTKEIDDVEYNVLRHTPRDRQALFLYRPLIIDAEAQVMPEIFNTEYLDLDGYEGVDYWQNFNDPAAIKVKAAIPGSDGTQTASDTISIPYVVGCIFDRDAILVNNYLEDSLATPVEARKRYYNIWWTFCRNAINDFSENFVLFYMDDSGVTPGGTGLTVTPETVTITVGDETGADVSVTLSDEENDWTYSEVGISTGDAPNLTLTGNAATLNIAAGDSVDPGTYVVVIEETGDGDVTISAKTVVVNVVAAAEG